MFIYYLYRHVNVVCPVNYRTFCKCLRLKCSTIHRRCFSSPFPKLITLHGLFSRDCETTLSCSNCCINGAQYLPLKFGKNVGQHRVMNNNNMISRPNKASVVFSKCTVAWLSSGGLPACPPSSLLYFAVNPQNILSFYLLWMRLNESNAR